MNKLLVIRDSDLFPDAPKATVEYEDRGASRAVLFDAEGNIALMHVSMQNYYKLPGGGIEEGESIPVAMERECMEETGCKAKAEKEIGMIEEYRDKLKLHQTSYCFFAEVVGEKGQTSFVGDEITDKFILMWVPLDEAISLTQNANPANYEGKFIQKRDVAFLQKAKEMM